MIHTQNNNLCSLAAQYAVSLTFLKCGLTHKTAAISGLAQFLLESVNFCWININVVLFQPVCKASYSPFCLANGTHCRLKSCINFLFVHKVRSKNLQVTLLSGVADLQEKTAASPRMSAYPGQFYFSAPSFTLIELDLGGNGMGSEGLRVLGTYMRYHSQLQYLGLAQTPCSDMEAWNVLFESLKVNVKLTHIILDENHLGDQGVKLFAEALKVNEGLRKVDLDSNGFGEVGGNAILEALLGRKQCSLEHLSLQENYISTTLMSKIQQVVPTLFSCAREEKIKLHSCFRSEKIHRCFCPSFHCEKTTQYYETERMCCCQEAVIEKKKMEQL
uniref:Uncharacterized protein n=1 Tax=Pygocentrus nattereri TaxID=42514 RepID=A0AAR2KTW0_PYGNA